MSAPHHLSAAWRDADALRTRGQLGAARDLLEPVADIAAIRLGADHPDVIETMRRLAGVHRELGELASARRVLEEALEGAQLRMAEDNPVILGISGELGSLADELGNRHEARRNFTRLARYGPAVLGPQHPHVRAAQRFLGTDAPVAESPPEAQAGFAPAQGYDVPPPGFGPHGVPATPHAAQGPPHAVPQGPSQFPTVPTREATAFPSAPTREGDPFAAPDAGPDVSAPPPVQEEPGVYRPAGQVGGGAVSGGPGPVSYRPALQESTASHPVVHPFAPPTVPPHPPPPVSAPDEERHRSRLPLLVLGIVTVLAVVAGGVFVVVTMLHPHPSSPQADASTSGGGSPTVRPSTAPSAPSDLRLRDDGNTITLTWTDPSGGTVPFFVEVGPPDGKLRIYGRLNPGETTYPVVGLNPKADYCFSVVAVYSTTVLATSNLACTQRTRRPAPTASG